MLLLLMSCMHHLSALSEQTIGGDRPARLIAPADWGGEPLPVIFLLHGLGSSAAEQDRYLRFSKVIEDRDFLLVVPDAEPRSKDDKRAWGATDYCCNPADRDVEYLTGLMDELEGMGAVTDFYLTGHSNGGFMSYRMACEVPGRIKAIAGLAGATWEDPARCTSGAPVNVLHIHGTDDSSVPYTGKPGQHPGAEESVARWAERAGCTGRAPAPSLDLTIQRGEETRRTVWECPDHQVALWTIEGGSHIPLVKRAYAEAVVDWLLETP